MTPARFRTNEICAASVSQIFRATGAKGGALTPPDHLGLHSFTSATSTRPPTTPLDDVNRMAFLDISWLINGIKSVN